MDCLAWGLLYPLQKGKKEKKNKFFEKKTQIKGKEWISKN